MQRKYSLKKNAQFKYVFRRGKSSGSKEMVLLYTRSNTLKIGFSVGKKIGGAVVRNRVKRRMRAAFDPFLPRMKKGLYVVIARPPVVDAEFKSISRSIQYLLKKQELLLPENVPVVEVETEK
ncbi:MAG: ribonuclease P protein component [Clostridia bacterium]|nr:ribonuclease P protein component [Clostridia bacterium]